MLDREFAWKGDRIRWTRYGAGPPVVLCHGTPWSSALWRPTADALAERFTVHLWDMRGFGASTMAADQDVSLGEQGQLFAELVRHWQLPEPPRVVAHDIGGAVALRAHLLHGLEYRSLALVDVVALAPWGSEFFRLVHDESDVFTRLPAPLHEALVRAYITGAAHRPLPPAAHDVLTAPWLGPTGQPAFYRQIAQADQRHTDAVEPLYPSISLPVLVVWGTEDQWIPVDRAHKLSRLIPGATLRLVPGAGHLIQLDAPDALLAILREWLTTQP
ncbi:alpha/beta fold hydrolase [Pseudonocardia lacus]|uniref:alpha/beta fold hydrolase n=1 Tax=Pseudonocardia lacus TaxID=2835865 RepID=UPI0027E22A36|nr:alpha/beta hydrolase [Pseudonocardia lacus]